MIFSGVALNQEGGPCLDIVLSLAGSSPVSAYSSPVAEGRIQSRDCRDPGILPIEASRGRTLCWEKAVVDVSAKAIWKCRAHRLKARARSTASS